MNKLVEWKALVDTYGIKSADLIVVTAAHSSDVL